MKFQKLTATGNDFLFIDARAQTVVKNRSELAAKMCDRHFGAGADGLVFVEQTSDAKTYKWDFYNSDGSSAEMCGNASRCMGRWLEHNLKLKKAEFETQAGLVRCESIDESEIKATLVYLKFAANGAEKLKYFARGADKIATLVNTGVPHAVVHIDDITQAKNHVEDIKALRFHEGAGVKGCNVTFLERVLETEFKTVTFERGVEGFTLSCGTGVLAAAVVGIRLTSANAPEMAVKLETPGGWLKVEFTGPDLSATLQGPAVLVYEGDLSGRV